MGFLIGKTLILALLSTFIFGCGSTGARDGSELKGSGSGKTFGLEDYDQGSTANGHAYHADAFVVRTPMQSRSEWKPWVHYYKHCEINGNETYHSRTSYSCMEPYY